jgi:GNAT superfamily N-acetyltransferase
MSAVLIKSFDVAQWREYRDIRLRALQDAPDAFGSTFEAARMLTDTQWHERMTAISAEFDLPLAAIADGQYAGMAWARIEQKEPTVTHLFQMWVAPEFRGHGIGSGILQKSIDWARTRGTNVITLGVTIGNSPARRLYEGHNFLPSGELEPLRPGATLNVAVMQLQLNDS